MINPYNIGEIRILPMDRKEEFKTEDAARKFLFNELVKQDGKYYFRERGIDIKNGYALILFQYGTSIIGYGILESVKDDSIIDEIGGKRIQYNGYLSFFTMSIHNIANITLDELQQIDKRITHFSNAKWRIGKENFNQVYNKIYNLLLQKQVEFVQLYISRY